MIRVLIVSVCGVFLSGCTNGGSLTLVNSFSLGSSVGSPNAELKGHCLSAGTAVVLNDGYCTEFYRTPQSTDVPPILCTLMFGLYWSGECPRPHGLEGRCLVRTGDEINATYFAFNPNGPTACSTALGNWQTPGYF
ncbi:MAG: hypothetical protein KF799_03360 [Bdellovibrionales bacterium]|nr:hypothetical protein [Bdellovibrionales bacterium]